MFALRFLDKEMPVPVVHVSLFNSNTHCKVKKRSSSIVKVPAILKKRFSKKDKKGEVGNLQRRVAWIVTLKTAFFPSKSVHVDRTPPPHVVVTMTTREK